ncbi:MAG: xanthine dehydrogenase family protein subunit M [Rhodobacteraceae bacterium]|nr:xanthine dehydrogenase family protein subunit M [Paracoccaceae bacterium]
MPLAAPQDLEEALALVAGGARPVAGCTDLYPALGDRPAPSDLVDLTSLAALRGIGRSRAGWRIGAATTWAALARAPLPPAFDGLRAAAREVGSVQVQNAGTLGGNLANASPAADGVPPLLALDARVVLRARGATRRLALADFLLGPRRTALRPGEIIAAVEVPAPPPDARSAFLKLGQRRYLVISVAMVAVLVWPDAAGRIAGARIAVGACSPVARRLPALEAALAGRPWGASGLPEDPAHWAPLAPIDDVRGSAAYRAHAVPELVARALAAAMGQNRG